MFIRVFICILLLAGGALAQSIAKEAKPTGRILPLE